jgi:Arc/MetJ-type ribon-helix-helix transcriptional regulator
MAIQLTLEQEQRIQAVISAGAYRSSADALDAALAAMEMAATLGFKGSAEELEGLLTEGLASKELTEEEFWDSVDQETNAMLSAYKQGLRA